MLKERKYILLNDISEKGLKEFGKNFGETQDIADADLWLVRSKNLLEAELPQRLRAIARAGAGVNNIPVDRATQEGIVVFNAPGGNANAVAELVVAGMLLASRGVLDGANWLRAQKPDPGLPDLAEKHKKAFSGTEIRGKRLGVVGLGAVGHLVANAAVSLGMEVLGHDPFISVEYALKLSQQVQMVPQLNDLLAQSDYISLHVPLIEKTRGMFNTDRIAHFKEGTVLLNFARDLLVDEEALGQALAQGKVKRYVTDFANEKVMGFPNTIILPHLGAATEESEENCAIMAARQAQDYLNNGNITNSVNFPNITLGKVSRLSRVVVLHKNVPGILSKVTTLFGEAGINIDQMVSASRGEAAVAIFDVGIEVHKEFAQQLASQPDILKVRVIYHYSVPQDKGARE